MEDPALLNKLKRIQKPAAFCCSNDNVSRGVLRASHELGFSTPDPIAILGINNNPLLCESGLVSLSSVGWPAQHVGHEAAHTLNTLLQKKKPPSSAILVPPTEVVTRQSTDIYAIDDDLVIQTLRLIRERAKDRIRIQDLVQPSGTSRRNLETRFRLVMKRSLHDEIRRVQIDLAKKALRETNAPMERVAHASGFGGGVHLGLEFKKHTGITPRTYRKQFDIASPPTLL
jgi:LacI family transcriptional regulator